MKTCAACKKPIKPHDFYVNAIRGNEAEEIPILVGNHPVHVPNCPSLSAEDAYALAGVDYEAAMQNEFKRVPPRDSLATTDHRAHDR